MEILENCTLCPRECKVNRKDGKIGRCRAGAKPKLLFRINLAYNWYGICKRC